jgi:hypothetical protein
VSGSDLTVSWAPVTDRYIKLIAQGTAIGGGGNWWSIDEINAYDAGPAVVTNLTVTETVTGAAGKVLKIRGAFLKSTAEDVGFRVGPSTSNFYGFIWKGNNTFTIQKCVSGSVSDIGSNTTFSNHTNVHSFEFSVYTPPAGSVVWLVATIYRYDGTVTTLATTDSAVTVTGGTLNFYVWALTNSYFRNPAYYYASA